MLVLFSPRAQAELRAAVDYHSDPAAATRFSLNVESLLLRMQRFPGSAQPRPDLTRRNVRFWFLAPLWFLTQKREGFLLVVSVVHASRDLRSYLRNIL